MYSHHPQRVNVSAVFVPSTTNGKVAEPIVVEPSESALTVLAKEKERLLKTLELIREQIAEIKSEFPYTMKELVESPEKIAEKKAEIEETLAELKEAYDFYSARLKEMLR